MFVCDKHDRAITCVFCRDLELISLFWSFTKRSVQRKVKFGREFIKQGVVICYFD